MNTVDQLTAILWRHGVALAEPPTLATVLQVERYAFAPTGFLQAHQARWEESKHPRAGKGKQIGGQFAPKGSGDTAGGGATGNLPIPKPPASKPKSTKKADPRPGKQFKGQTFGGTTYDLLHGDDGKWYARLAGERWLKWSRVADKDVPKVEQRLAPKKSQGKTGQKPAANPAAKPTQAEWRPIHVPPEARKPFSGFTKQNTFDQLFRLLVQPTVVAPTLEQQAARAEAAAKAKEEAQRRAVESKADVRQAAKEDRGQRLRDVAADYGVDEAELFDAAKELLVDKRKVFEDREAAKAGARASTGLTLNDVKRWENSGHDYSTVKTRGGLPFDAAARQVARSYPGVIGDPDNPQTDLAAGLWDLLREGAQPPPSLYDPEVLREAADFLHKAKQPAGVAEGFPWEGVEEFARPGWKARYALKWAVREECRRRRESISLIPIS